MRHVRASAQASSGADVQQPDVQWRRALTGEPHNMSGRGLPERPGTGVYVYSEENGIDPRRPSGKQPEGRHRVIVVGGGFAGLQAVRGLRKADAEVTLVDRRNFHLFQPLLYQLATHRA